MLVPDLLRLVKLVDIAVEVGTWQVIVATWQWIVILYMIWVLEVVRVGIWIPYSCVSRSLKFSSLLGSAFCICLASCFCFRVRSRFYFCFSGNISFRTNLCYCLKVNSWGSQGESADKKCAKFHINLRITTSDLKTYRIAQSALWVLIKISA